MNERIMEYRNKCKVLKQIQSNKALFYKRINNIQNVITVLVSGFITFIGFSGVESIKSFIQILNIEMDNIYIQMGYNFMVFLLFVMVIFHMVFRFNERQAESEKAVSLLSSLINEIDDILENKQSYNSASLIRGKYLLVIQMIPSNTDREYIKAKKTLEKKEIKTKPINKFSLLASSRQEQENYIINLVKGNYIIQHILDVLQREGDYLYLGGGVIRNIIWDDLHNYNEMTQIDDIDVIYYDKEDSTKSHDQAIEKRLQAAMPNYKWSVKNQARMHKINNDEQYEDLYDAISKWPETASAMLIKKSVDETYTIIAPFGYDDLFRLIVRPTPHFMGKLDRYRQRVLEHNWKEKWSKLTVFYMEEPQGSNTQ